MFNKLTTQEDIKEAFCRCMIRNLLGREVSKIIVQAEKVEVPDDPMKRGVRLDVEVRELDSHENVATIYDIEPHRDIEDAYPKKNRFIQAQIDKNNLASGENNFNKLPDLYIICITNYDPFGHDRMLYTVKNSCVEDPDLLYNDGVTIMYFNTTGTKGGSDALHAFLSYLEDSKSCNIVDKATEEVSQYVNSIKHNYEIGGRYMTVGDLMDKYAAEAVAEKEAEMASIIADKDAEIADKNAEIERLKLELASYKQ